MLPFSGQRTRDVNELITMSFFQFHKPKNHFSIQTLFFDSKRSPPNIEGKKDLYRGSDRTRFWRGNRINLKFKIQIFPKDKAASSIYYHSRTTSQRRNGLRRSIHRWRAKSTWDQDSWKVRQRLLVSEGKERGDAGHVEFGHWIFWTGFSVSIFLDEEEETYKELGWFCVVLECLGWVFARNGSGLFIGLKGWVIRSGLDWWELGLEWEIRLTEYHETGC